LTTFKDHTHTSGACAPPSCYFKKMEALLVTLSNLCIRLRTRFRGLSTLLVFDTLN
jgi:hypothetical protein